MRKLNKIVICLSIGATFGCHGEWYSQNPNAWLKAIENTDRARERALEKKAAYKNPLPVKGLITGEFGMRLHPVIGEYKHHNGIDIAAKRGSPIRTVEDGTVVRATYSPTFGKVVELDHGNGKVTRYAHADSIKVGVGDYVRKGSQIATVGSTGLATGPHIHFEVLEHGVQVNPLKRFKHVRNASEQLKVVNRTNASDTSLLKDTSHKHEAIQSSGPIASKQDANGSSAYEVIQATAVELLPKETIIADKGNVKATGASVELVEQNVAALLSEQAIEPAVLKSIKLSDSVAIWDLAKEIRGENSIYQAILAIYKLNPDVFIKHNINLRKRGVHIVLPDEAYIATMSRKEGLAKVNDDNRRLKSS
jgi:FimV-like protein